MSIIYLCVKTHKKTGLKYLCKTERDPFKYKGSGLYWKRHLKYHGSEHDTEILKECQTVEELKEWGLYYSELWNVVESDEWANMRPEEGDGGDTSKSENYIIGMKNRKSMSGSNNPMYGIGGMKGKTHSPDTIERQKDSHRVLWENMTSEERKSRGNKVIGQKNGMFGQQPTNNPGIKIEYDGIIYDSISRASKITGISVHFIKKNGKIL